MNPTEHDLWVSAIIVGFVVVGMFVLTWALALLVWRYGRFEERWTSPESAS